MTGRIRVLFLTQTGPIGASARYRVYQYLDYLAKSGVDATVAPAVSDELALRYLRNPRSVRFRYYASIFFRRLRDLARLRSFDVVFLQRDFIVHTFPLLEIIAAVIHPRIVFDIDDALFLIPAGKRPGPLLRLLWDKRKIERIAKRSVVAVAGNMELARYLAPFATHVCVIPTSIETRNYPTSRSSPNRNRTKVIGWIGSSGTVGYLAAVVPAIERLHERGHAVLLRVIGATIPGSYRFPVECRPWDLSTEISEIAEFDVGIMPLSDDAWSRAKSGTKLLQYLAAGVPAVASPVGVNSEILRDNIGGLLASTVQDWEQSLERLISSASLREELGNAGRERVLERYSIEVSAPKLLAALELAYAQ